MTNFISLSRSVAVVAGLFLSGEIQADDAPVAQTEGGVATETAADSGQPDEAARPEGNRVAVTISKQTTCIVEPLRDDGYVDYLAAFNAFASEGVTPENNAMVPLIRLIGPKNIDAPLRARFFQMLGIAALPEKGNYLISLENHLAELNLDAEETAKVLNE